MERDAGANGSLSRTSRLRGTSGGHLPDTGDKNQQGGHYGKP